MRTEMFRAKKHSVKIPRFAWLNRSWIEPLMDIAQDLRKADLGDLAPSVEWLTLGAVVH